MEVKSSLQADADNAQKDLGKLQTFVEKVKYGHGIFLVFGPSEIPDLNVPNERISVLWHKEVGQVQSNRLTAL